MSVKSDLEVLRARGQLASRSRASSPTISVSGVTGAVKAETVNGAITQTGAAKEVDLQSVNGAVDVTKAARPHPRRGRQRHA